MHGKPWCNDSDRGKVLIRPPELLGVPSSSHLVAKHEELWKEMMNFASRRTAFVHRSVLSHAVKSYMGPITLLPLRRKEFQIFIAFKIHCPRPGLNLRTLGPMASTLTFTPPTTTWYITVVTYYLLLGL
jgi:hypothetical protein